MYCVARGHIGSLFVSPLVSCAFLFPGECVRRQFRRLRVCRVGGIRGLCIGTMMCVFLGVLCVVVFGSFLCSWVVGRIRVVLSVDNALSRLVLMRC